jgi:hypothetical protein
VDRDIAVVFNEAQLSEFVHEKIHARSSGTDLLGKRLLINFHCDRARGSRVAKVCHQQKQPG